MRVRFYKGLLVLGDIVIFFLALAAALALRRPALFSPEYYWAHVNFFSFILPILLGVNAVLGLYDFRQIRDLAGIIGESLLASAYTFVAAVLVYYFSGTFLPSPKTYLFLTLFMTFVAGVYWRRLWMSMSSSSLFSTKVLFLGDNGIVRRIIGDIRSQRHTRFRVIGPAQVLAAAVAGGGAAVSRMVDLIVVDPDKISEEPGSREIVASAVDNAVPVWTYTDFYEDIYKKVPPYIINKDAWMLAHVLHRKNSAYIWAKEILGFLFSVAVVVLLLPLLPLVALAIKLEDGGPVFYSQPRVGFLKKTFRVFKFRTMKVGADNAGYLWGTANGDARITRVGRFLRKFRLDELPQLWNILRGEMALVGPRPTWTEEKQALGLPDYHMRTLVKPGITGWAQINSTGTDNEDDTFEKLCYDLYYIKNLSFALDLSILLKTVRRVFQSDHAMRLRRHAARHEVPKTDELQAVK